MRCIDADALKRKYEDHKRLFCRNRIEFSTLSDKDKARADELDNCIADILNAPTIDPERKTGKWIYHKDWDDDGECGYECSECGMGSEVNYNYCMRCGAKMEEGDHT